MLLAIFLATVEPIVVEPELRRPSHSEMDGELRQCGIHHFTIRYEEDLQSEVVEVRDAQVTDDQLRCIYRTADYTPYLVLWADDRLRMRYYELGDQLARPRALARARAYFDARPELGKPPVRKSGQSELDFARSIERFCGPLASGAFSDEHGSLTVSGDWLDPDGFLEKSEVFGCLLQASTVSGLEIGFLANEKAAEPAD